MKTKHSQIPIKVSDTGRISVDPNDVVRSERFQRDLEILRKVRTGSKSTLLARYFGLYVEEGN